ncbi:MAG: nucleoside triphosphate pyrophosphohydrolase [Pseudomonadota bacterium]
MTHISKLIDVMAALRDPESGCPWDLEQDFASIAPYTIEEAYEVADAIERGALHELPDELGDLLLQVVFHARMAEEQGLFAFDDVVTAIVDKMIRRHPHVFGDEDRGDSARVLGRWEDIKAAERAAAGRGKAADESALAGVAAGLPALQRAVKLGKRAGRAGFDWRAPEQVRGKVDEELSELAAAIAALPPGADAADSAVEDELGDLLFSVAQWSRHLGVDPARALRRASAKFERRFRRMEADLDGSLDDHDDAALDAAWESAKAREA